MPWVNEALYRSRECDFACRDDRICYQRETVPGDCEVCPAREDCKWLGSNRPAED